MGSFTERIERYETLPLPQLLMVDDYHEFANFERMINQLKPGRKIRIVELRLNGEDYVGLVYAGRHPRQEIVDQLLLDNGIEGP